jgi:phospholipid/cholesterol/gamma-HCH transport system ATP-binding protein
MVPATTATGQQLVVALASQQLEFELNRGRTYQVITSDPQVHRTLVAQLNDTGLAAVVPPDGGLIGNLKVWENLVLPRAYHGRPRYAELESRAERVYGEFGIVGSAFKTICAGLPDRLDRFERRLTAFARAILAEPEIMVYDSLFEGLTKTDVETLLGFDRVFHMYFPFRTSVYVTPDAAKLPEVGAHRTYRL